jgi:release factor glutamine methyltransferase
MEAPKGPAAPPKDAAAEQAKAWTVLALIQWTTAFLKQKGIDNSRREAEDLLGHVLELDRLKLYLAFEVCPSPAELASFRALVARRGKREPLQYLLGWQPFLDLKLRCDARALIPRPETEKLATLAIQALAPLGSEARFGDIGTGSGCIALAILKTTQAQGTATDISEAALALALENAQALGLEGRLRLAQGSFGAPLEAGLDLIVSNPPYIPLGEGPQLQVEVRDHEPKEALFAGAEGTEALKAILEGAAPKLKVGGWLMLECGMGQPAALSAWLGSHSQWSELKIEKDQFGIERFLILRKG